jgi:hypothetical protein
VFNYLLLRNFGSTALVIQGALLTIYSVVSSASVPVTNAGNQLVGLYRSEDDAGGILITVRYVLQVNFSHRHHLNRAHGNFPAWRRRRCWPWTCPETTGAWIYALRFFRPVPGFCLL